MTGQPQQRSRADVEQAEPEQVLGWLRDGALDDLLHGRPPTPPPEPKPDDQPDETRQLSRDDLTDMTTDEIAAALAAGRFDDLLARR
jgi:hypothetical protein